MDALLLGAIGSSALPGRPLNGLATTGGFFLSFVLSSG